MFWRKQISEFCFPSSVFRYFYSSFCLHYIFLFIVRCNIIHFTYLFSTYKAFCRSFSFLIHLFFFFFAFSIILVDSFLFFSTDFSLFVIIHLLPSFFLFAMSFLFLIILRFFFDFFLCFFIYFSLLYHFFLSFLPLLLASLH